MPHQYSLPETIEPIWKSGQTQILTPVHETEQFYHSDWVHDRFDDDDRDGKSPSKIL
jgi:predicted metal-dependent HD superfamily phosphohydrolase